MAKRITKLFQKDSSGDFNLIKIGSSAQYITIDENAEEKEYLKQRLDQIGDPKNLTPNLSLFSQSIVACLNEVNRKVTEVYSKFDNKLSRTGGTMLGNIKFDELEGAEPGDIIFEDSDFENEIITYIGPIN